MAFREPGTTRVCVRILAFPAFRSRSTDARAVLKRVPSNKEQDREDGERQRNNDRVYPNTSASGTINIFISNYREFNDIVNMTPQELKEWLSQDRSVKAGWSKLDGSGETVEHER